MFSCPECKKRFSFRSGLHRHLNEIHLERTHSCEGCGKTFKRSHALKTHKHSGRCNHKHTSNVNEKSYVGDIFGDALSYESGKGSFEETDDDLEETESPSKMEFDCVDGNLPGRFFAKERSPLDIAMHSVMSNQELDTRNKLKGYFKVVGDHLRCKRFGCLQSKVGIDEKSNHSLEKVPNSHYKNISEEDEENYHGDDDSEDDESRTETIEDDSSTENHQSGIGANRDIFGGALVNSMMECDASGEESENDNTLEDTDDDSCGDDSEAKTEESDEVGEETLEDVDDINKDYENSEDEDKVYEKVNINWPQYNVKKPWQSYGEKIVLFDQLPWLRHIATSQSSLILMKEIRHATEPRILALCEIALNLLMDHIPMTVEDFNCYKNEKDSLRELAYVKSDWKRKRFLLGSNSTLIWILLVSLEPLYAA